MHWFSQNPDVWLTTVLLIILGLIYRSEVWKNRHSSKGSNLVPAPQQPAPTEEEHRRAEQTYWARQFEAQRKGSRVGWAAIVFSGVAAIAAFLTYITAREETAYLHRPHFRVRFARVIEAQEGLFVRGKPVSVIIDILNNGQADAVVEDSHLEVYWTNEGLPGYFPYVPGKPFNHFASKGEGKRIVIEAGGGNQQTTVQGYSLMDDEGPDIAQGRNGWSMYLLGWIGYHRPDDRYNRFFDFALQLKPGTRRFLPVKDDPDYAQDPDGK